MAAWLSEQGGVVLLKIKVSPGAKQAKCLGPHADRLKWAVNAPPEKGKANAALEKAIAQTLGVPKAQVQVVSGHTHRDKTVAVAGIDAAGVKSALE